MNISCKSYRDCRSRSSDIVVTISVRTNELTRQTDGQTENIMPSPTLSADEDIKMDVRCDKLAIVDSCVVMILNSEDISVIPILGHSFLITESLMSGKVCLMISLCRHLSVFLKRDCVDVNLDSFLTLRQ